MPVISIRGISSTKVRLSRLEKRTNKRAFRRAEKGANDIKKLAALLTPYKTGDLQNSIRVREKKQGYGLGWRRTTWEIGVDASLLNLQKRKGFPYHQLMHDDNYNLGPGSKLKSAATRGLIPAGVKRGTGSSKIGRHYISRSIEYHEKYLIRDMEKIAISEASQF